MAGIVHEVENHRLVEQAEQEAAEAARRAALIFRTASTTSKSRARPGMP